MALKPIMPKAIVLGPNIPNPNKVGRDASDEINPISNQYARFVPVPVLSGMTAMVGIGPTGLAGVVLQLRRPR